MKVLELDRNGCWSFIAQTPVALDKLRTAAALPDNAARQRAIAALMSVGNAYRLVGNPTGLELADDFFDDVVLRYAPSTTERAILQQRGARWLKQPEKMGRALRGNDVLAEGGQKARGSDWFTRLAQSVRDWTTYSRPSLAR